MKGVRLAPRIDGPVNHIKISRSLIEPHFKVKWNVNRRGVIKVDGPPLNIENAVRCRATDGSENTNVCPGIGATRRCAQVCPVGEDHVSGYKWCAIASEAILNCPEA